MLPACSVNNIHTHLQGAIHKYIRVVLLCRHTRIETPLEYVLPQNVIACSNVCYKRVHSGQVRCLLLFENNLFNPCRLYYKARIRTQHAWACINYLSLWCIHYSCCSPCDLVIGAGPCMQRQNIRMRVKKTRTCDNAQTLHYYITLCTTLRV